MTDSEVIAEVAVGDRGSLRWVLHYGPNAYGCRITAEEFRHGPDGALVSCTGKPVLTIPYRVLPRICAALQRAVGLIGTMRCVEVENEWIAKEEEKKT